ncbi:MAG: hypothetical protein ABJF23_23855 [Bryobacteraceae bacterium]
MPKAIANPKIFAAACVLFAVATLFNVNAHAGSQGDEIRASGIGLRAPEQISAPVLEVGPTIPPSPWDDDAPSLVASGKR